MSDGYSQQLYFVCEFLSHENVEGVNPCYALNVNFIYGHKNAVSDCQDQSQFVSAVYSFYVQGRVSLGISKLLGFPEHFVK